MTRLSFLKVFSTFLKSVSLFFLDVPHTVGQNLVPNPSFEQHDSCPDNVGQISRALSWNSLNSFTTPDYFNVCGSPNLFSVPNNGFGYQHAASGNAYIGLLTYHLAGQKEYVFAELNQPLINNQQYFVSMKANFPNFPNGAPYSILANKTGALFSVNKLDPIYQEPNTSHIYTSSLISDTLNWVTIKGSFIADSAYSFINIGNFFSTANTDTQIIAGANIIGYYYIDDICVSTDSLICYNDLGNKPDSSSLEIFSMYQIPSSNNIEIKSNSVNAFDVFIYSQLGQLLYNSFNNTRELLIDFSAYESSVYLIVCRASNTMIIEKIFYINQ